MTLWLQLPQLITKSNSLPAFYFVQKPEKKSKSIGNLFQCLEATTQKAMLLLAIYSNIPGRLYLPYLTDNLEQHLAEESSGAEWSCGRRGRLSKYIQTHKATLHSVQCYLLWLSR